MDLETVLKRLKDKKGQSLVEMALILPVLILCLGLIITAGQLLYAKMTLQMAAFEGARGAVVQTNKNTAKTTADKKAKAVTANGIGLQNVNYSLTAPSSWKRGNEVTYTVTAQVKTLFPLIAIDGTNLVKNPTIKGTAVMMIERN
jgi:Flp pilus assembly protein TadG